MVRECYPVWDLESGNMLYAYDTEEEALRLVRATIDEHGPETVRYWVLEREQRGRVITLAEGEALVTRALAVTPASSSAQAG